MSSLAISKVQISFWQPIIRDRRHTTDLHVKIGEAFFDYIIDPLYTSPFASRAYSVTQWHRSEGSWNYTIISRDIPVERLGQLIRAVVVIAGLIYHRRTTVALLATGLAIKALCRSKETYFIDNSGASRRISSSTSPHISEEQRERNLEKWAQKWWCDTMFYLFAIGSDDTITLPSKPSEEGDPMVEVNIDIAWGEYPLSFLNSLPFFRVLMSSEMRDVQEGKIYLTKDFPYNHEALKALERSLADSSAVGWEDGSQHDFLCLGMRQDEAPHVWRLGEMQRIIAERDFSALRSSFPDVPPGVKVGSYTFNFLHEVLRPPLNFEGKSYPEALHYAKGCLKDVMRQETATQRHYHVNRIVNEFVSYLHQNKDRSISETNLLSPLLELIHSKANAANHLTVLDLPATLLEDRDARLLPFVISACPNLKWLALESFQETFRIEADDVGSLNTGLNRSMIALLEQEQDLPKDFIERHENLRILKIEGQKLTPGQARKLKELFPKLDILEAEVLKIR